MACIAVRPLRGGSNGNVVLTGKGTIKATNNYTVRNYGNMVIDGVTVENGIMNFADLTVESGNISNSRSGKHTIYSNSGNLTINGGNFYNGNPGNAAIFSYSGEVVINGGEFSIADGTATLGWTSCLLDAQGGAKFTINGGVVNGEIRDYNKNTVVYGGTFSHTPSAYVADGFKAFKNNDGTFIVLPEDVDGLIYNVDQLKAAFANGGEYILTANIELAETVTLAAGKTLVLDLNGNTVSGVDTASIFSLIHVKNGAEMTLNDSVGTGKVTYDAAEGKTGAAIFVEGKLIQNAGTIEITGEWSIGFAVDAHPNAWGSTYTEATEFIMNGGKIVASDSGVRVANYSAANAADSAAFTMNDGIIDSVYDAIFVQHVNACDLKVVINDGTITSGTHALRIYGNVVNDVYVTINGGVLNGKLTNLNNSGNGVVSVKGGSFTDLQNAITYAADGATIGFAADFTGDVTFTQINGVSLVIDGNDKVMNGSINIIARADTSDKATIVIKNINFKTADTERVFIHSNETNRYPNNVTVSGCTFEGAGADSNVVAINIKSSNNFVIENCTATKVHSLLQNTSGWNLTIKNVTVTEAGRGMALGTVQGVTLENVTVDCAKYGIRMDAGYNNNAVITDCNVKAFIPVVVRKVSVASNVTFNGTNTMVGTNTDGLWCAIGASEYETNGTMPTAASATVTVTLNDAGLNVNGVYNNSGK